MSSNSYLYSNISVGHGIETRHEMNKSLFLTIIPLIIVSCDNKPNTLNYVDIYGDNNNLVCKYNPKDSNAIIYFNNNETYMIGKLINSKREGVWKEYLTKENELNFKWSFKDDIKDGIYFGYTLTGKIETVGYYKNDQLNGTLVYFDLKQKPEKVQVWKGIENADGASELILEKKLK